MDSNRRQFLGGVCGIVTGATAGCLSRFRSQNGSIPSEAVDITDHGADPTGQESIYPALEAIAEDGAVVYFPDGEYALDETWSFTEFEEFSMIGPEATIVPAEGFDSHLFRLNSQTEAASLRFEGFSFDISAPETGGRLLDAQIHSELVIRDLTVEGRTDGGPNLFRLDVTDPDGNGLVERLSAPDGAVGDSTISGCYVGNGSHGDIRFVDCRIEGFPDNGLYADPPAGRIVVDGGYYANSGISNVRVRAGSLVENVHVRCDNASEGFRNMRGIRLTNYSPDPEAPPAVVKNCTVEVLDVSSSDGAIELSSDLTAAEVYDTQIQVDVDGVPALRAKAPDESFEEYDSENGFHCENVQITGSSATQSVVYVVDRNDCVFDNLCVHQTGDDRDGIELLRSDNNRVQNSYFNISGEPVVLREATSEVSSLRTQPLETNGAILTGSECG